MFSKDFCFQFSKTFLQRLVFVCCQFFCLSKNNTKSFEKRNSRGTVTGKMFFKKIFFVCKLMTLLQSLKNWKLGTFCFQKQVYAKFEGQKFLLPCQLSTPWGISILKTIVISRLFFKGFKKRTPLVVFQQTNSQVLCFHTHLTDKNVFLFFNKSFVLRCKVGFRLDIITVGIIMEDFGSFLLVTQKRSND